MNELGIVYLFLALLVLFILIGALLPRYLPGLIRLLDTTVLKEERGSDGHTDPHTR